MSTVTEAHTNIADTLSNFGGHLECTKCSRVAPVGPIATRLATGWRKHCGLTMTWVTKQQEGETQS